MATPTAARSHDQGGDRLGERIAQARAERQDAAERDQDARGPGPRPSQHADTGGDRHGHCRDEQVEDELVGLADQVDHELLGARRLERDDEVADRDDRTRGTRQQAGKQLGHAQRGGARGNARDGGGRAAGDRLGIGWHRHRSSLAYACREQPLPARRAGPISGVV